MVDKIIKNLLQYQTHPTFTTEIKNTEQTKEFILEDLVFSSTTERQISALQLYPHPQKYKAPYSTILFVHWFEPKASNSNRQEFLPVAKKLAQKGYASLLIDAYWSTTPEEFEKHPVLYWNQDIAHDTQLCLKQITEILDALEYLKIDTQVDNNRLAFVGHDFGAMYGSIVANLVNDFSTYILMAATTEFRHWFKFGSKLTAEAFQKYAEAIAIFDPSKHIQGAYPASILFQFATDDFYVPKGIATSYYEAAKEPKELRWYQAGHSLNQQAFADLEEWITNKL